MSLSRSRPRFQLMKPMTRLSRKSAKPGMGAGLKCGSVICAMTKLIHGRPSWRSAKARRPRAIDHAEIRLLERKDNPGWIWRIRNMAVSIGERLRLRVLHLGFLVTRPMSLGVRAIVISADDEVMLVRHGYVSGWHFPGGGVEVGETCVESMTRELEEEARIALEGPPVLHGLFFNTQTSKRDHVAAYVVRNFRVLGERTPNWEIREARFFPRLALPEGTTKATRARLAEIFDSAPVSDRW